MDWHFGCGIDDLIVPKDGGGLSDRLPSPDSWSEWGISGSDIFQSQYKCGGFEEDGFDAKSFSDDAEIEDSVCDRYYYDWSAVSSLRGGGGFSDESSRRIGDLSNRPDYLQLDLVGSGSVDDISLCSLQEDLPRIDSLDESFCSSPKSQHGAEKLSSCRGERDLSSASQNASSDVPSLGSSRYLKRRAFSPTSGLEYDCSPDLQGKDGLPIKDPSIVESVPSENRHGDEETSLEEAVLCELKMVMNQLTENTRISFRDALYRLAKNSDQHCMTQNQHGDVFAEIPPRCTLDVETARSGTNIATESETNVIDRAIASLMFNRTTDFDARDLPGSHRNSGDRQVPLDDAEVPIFGQTFPCNGSINRSLVLDFGSTTK